MSSAEITRDIVLALIPKLELEFLEPGKPFDSEQNTMLTGKVIADLYRTIYSAVSESSKME